MRKFVLAMALILIGASAAEAKEPINLAKYGLSSLRKMSDRDAQRVRGTGMVTASGLSSLAAIFYDPSTGSKANVDLVNFSYGSDNCACDSALAQNYNQIGVQGPLTISFPGGVTASISTFSAGGASQGAVSLTSGVIPVHLVLPPLQSIPN